MCKDILKRHGDAGRVDFAKAEDECIDKLLHNSYDIVLLSYEIDNSNGLNILERILSIRMDLPIVMLIEEGNELIAQKALDRGAYDYITKVKGHLTALPFTVRKVIERKRINTQRQSPNKKREDSSDMMDSGEALYVLDKQGRFLSANSKMEKLMGYSEAELLELTMLDLLPQEQGSSFYQWLMKLDSNGNEAPFHGDVISKTGKRFSIEIFQSILRDEKQKIVGYQGKVRDTAHKKHHDFSTSKPIDQVQMVDEFVELMNSMLNEPIQLLLERIAEIAASIFKFRKITLALLDRRRHVFIKQAMLGFPSEKIADESSREVPEKVISKIFSDQRKIKVLYSNRDGIFDYDNHNDNLKEHILFERPSQNIANNIHWRKQDLIIVNLVDKGQRTFGYLSLTEPLDKKLSTRDIFHNLKIFGKLASLAIETHYQMYAFDKRNRRLKQILVTSNIFKLHLNLNELLKEVVWSVKLLLDFDLVALALVSSRSGMLEVRAVACDDKIKKIQLEDLRFSIPAFSRLLKEQYKRSKSYLVDEDNTVLKSLKNIYYGSRKNFCNNGYWKKSTTLLVPIPTRDHKISGFLIVDDPTNWKIPNNEVLRTLELLANQVGVAIDNRIVYTEMKNRLKKLERYLHKEDSERKLDKTSELRDWVNKYLD